MKYSLLVKMKLPPLKVVLINVINWFKSILIYVILGTFLAVLTVISIAIVTILLQN